MKRIKRILIIWTILSAILYLLASFGYWQFNAFYWSETGRRLFGLVSFALLFLSFVIEDSYYEQD